MNERVDVDPRGMKKSCLDLFPGPTGGYNLPCSRRGAGRIITLCLVMISLWCLVRPLCGAAQSFVKVNSGTKANIRKIKMTGDGGGYFITDKIYALENDAWKKMDFPVVGKIFAFDALSKNDIWFSTTLETSTSMVYHYHDGITENIESPFGNDISSIFFNSGQLGFFASYSDAVLYNNGAFGKVIPLPSSGYIFRINGLSSEKYWILTQFNELFAFDKGKLMRMFPDKIVKDFQYTTADHGFLLCDDAVLEVRGFNIIRQYPSPLLKHARAISIHQNELWVIGDSGLILTRKNEILCRISYEGREDLNWLDIGPANDIWIAGDNGLLLYSGDKSFPVYNENYPGFAAQKLITYGIDVDNEYGVALSDINGDDKTDIYAVCISDPDRLYINKTGSENGGQTGLGFSEEAAKRGASGITRDLNSRIPAELKLGVAVADVDNDGDEDIYLCSLNGRNKLLLNNGKGFFRNVSDQRNRACEDVNRSNAAAFADVDLDGDLDLFVTSEQGSNRLFLNDGNGYFADITRRAGLSSEAGGMCASFSDVNADGYPDLCVTFWYPCNKIYLNDTRNGNVRFRDITWATDLAVAPPAKSNAVVFADVNNDGFSDLFIANRFIANKLYLNNGKGIFKDVTFSWFGKAVYMSNGAVFADFDLDGYQDLYVTNVGDNVMYKNIDGKHFEDVTGKFGAELSGYSTGCAVGDIDNDGDADLYAANYINGSSMLFLNKMEQRNAVTFKVAGTRSNRNGIGTKIYLYADKPGRTKDSLAGFREINGGSGYGSISAKEAIFAMHPGMNYYAIVKFPSAGRSVRIDDLLAGTVIRVGEETGFSAIAAHTRKAVIRFFIDPEIRIEMLKYLAVLMMLLAYLRIQRKGPAQIIMTRWMLSVAIFVLFVVVNNVFLFSSSVVLFLASPALAIISLIILHLLTERSLLRMQTEREKTELREKISRDLHDDLASTLGSISIYSSTLKGMNSASQVNFQYLSAKISELTQSALQSITDIIWMTAPRNDSLQSLLLKVNAMMFDVLTESGIRFDEKTVLPEHVIILNEKLRHDTFLILKEALNNVIRHSGAQHVSLHARYIDNSCYILFADDGQGFRVDEVHREDSHGNGLVNMRRRAMESGIELQIQSVPGAGTRIEISFKI